MSGKASAPTLGAVDHVTLVARSRPRYPGSSRSISVRSRPAVFAR